MLIFKYCFIFALFQNHALNVAIIDRT